MSLGSIFLVLALFSLSGLGICHKVADFRGCRPSAVSVTMFAAEAVVLWGYTIVYKMLAMNVGLFPPFTPGAVAVAVACGACAGIAILTFQVGVRHGRISTSWLVINLSTIVPALLSLVIYEEWRMGIKWQQLVGLVLVFSSVICLWRDKAVELAQGGEEAPRTANSGVQPTSRSGPGGLKSGLATAVQEEA
jgi:hypothetical protein